jgi:hypothetical protein
MGEGLVDDGAPEGARQLGNVAAVESVKGSWRFTALISDGVNAAHTSVLLVMDGEVLAAVVQRGIVGRKKGTRMGSVVVVIQPLNHLHGGATAHSERRSIVCEQREASSVVGSAIIGRIGQTAIGVRGWEANLVRQPTLTREGVVQVRSITIRSRIEISVLLRVRIQRSGRLELSPGEAVVGGAVG